MVAGLECSVNRWVGALLGILACTLAAIFSGVSGRALITGYVGALVLASLIALIQWRSEVGPRAGATQPGTVTDTSREEGR